MNRIWQDLRAANNDRQRKWDPDSRIDMTWRLNELAGESGEVCNLFKKWDREKIGLPGSRATPESIMEELADVVICTDLVLMQAGLNPDTEFLWNPFGRNPAAPLAELGIWITACIGRACALHTEDDYGEEFVGSLLEALRFVGAASAAFPRISFPIAVSRKFNKTSHTVGLPVFLDVGGVITSIGQDPLTTN